MSAVRFALQQRPATSVATGGVQRHQLPCVVRSGRGQVVCFSSLDFANMAAPLQRPVQQLLQQRAQQLLSFSPLPPAQQQQQQPQPASPAVVTLPEDTDDADAYGACMGMSFAETIKYVSNARQAPGIVRLSSPEELSILRALAADLGMVIVASLAPEAGSKASAKQWHAQLDAMFSAQLARTNTIFVKVVVPTSSMRTTSTSIDESSGDLCDNAWAGFRLPDGRSLACSALVTFAECRAANMLLVCEGANLAELRQMVSDAAYRATCLRI